ncbi:carboxypeptidase-like regulatory domain-containing protein [Dawidia soli]|uniref:Carboxypeptidase-like regulatory domain-containing protein n=1 Tax=Dawidia soli TaxID=2782352 RepID=A0AAP2GGD2_9BACT|nr:carboxypeptidase-like regulatory domain-containing protein [Dawidia soli]MBT1690424.1 carboxypeptidase-like regulatory domain-containing protein [Dawidia soli]
MSKCFTIAFLVIATLVVAQTRYRTVSGRLADKDNQPLPGVSVLVKGTATGTVTNADGNYSLQAPIGGTLVFSLIGMKTREALVMENDLIPVIKVVNLTAPRKASKRKAPFVLTPDSTAAGVAILGDNTPTFVLPTGSTLEAEKIRSIKPTPGSRVTRTKTFRVRMAPYIGYSLQFTTAIGIERITQTPALQRAYVQGRPQGGAPQWRGPEYQEIFSWGPALSSLQYDGGPYPYDQNGRLVPVGTGNGKAAKAYDAAAFLRTGFNTAYNLVGSLQRSGWGTLSLDASHKKQNGVIPNAASTQDHILFRVKKLPLYKTWTTDIQLAYDRSAGTLVNRGGNYASIVGAVWRTPVSFDNANGFSPRRAVESSLSSRLTNGGVRTHAAGFADNPYGMVRELPDEDLTKRLVGGITVLHQGTKGLSLTTRASVEKQWNDVVSGVPAGLSGALGGRITQRRQEQTGFDLSVEPSYTKQIGRHRVELAATYDQHYQGQDLDRVDGLGFLTYEWGAPGERTTRLLQSPTRSIQEVSASGTYTAPDNVALVKFSNRSYFSNTLPAARYTNFFPYALAKLFLYELWSIYPVNELTIHGSFGRTLREAPLLYSDWSYLSTRGPADQYATFYEARELFFNDRLLPETENKIQAGIDFNLRHRLLAYFSLYNNVTHDFIAPVWTNGAFEFTNVGRVQNYGTTATIRWYRPNSYGKVGYDVSLHWSRQNSVVRKLYTSNVYVPLAGFSTVSKVLAEDQPLGAIYGTRYQRNASGQVMIGEDGFPLVDPAMTRIGNPIADWTAGLELGVTWNRWALECIWDIRKGGDVWNGTRAALDYLGRSATTGDERNVYHYIFPGVDPQGDPNVTPVSFYDATAPLEQNRWVRYGFTGVGEAYIEDASWVRLQELAVSYSVLPPATSKIQEIKFWLIANNLLLLTGYSGVDPASSLFGYTGGTGLDLFNTPATRSFTVKMTIKL